MQAVHRSSVGNRQSATNSVSAFKGQKKSANIGRVENGSADWSDYKIFKIRTDRDGFCVYVIL